MKKLKEYIDCKLAKEVMDGRRVGVFDWDLESVRSRDWHLEYAWLKWFFEFFVQRRSWRRYSRNKGGLAALSAEYWTFESDLLSWCSRINYFTIAGY